MPRFVMIAGHDNDGDYIARQASRFSILSSPYKRLRIMPREDEDGDIEMADGDEIETDEAKDVGSPNSPCTAASAYINPAVVNTIRKFTSTRSRDITGIHIKDPACSQSDVKEDLYAICEVHGIRDSSLAGSCSDSEPASQGPPISLRDHASLHPAASHRSFEKSQQGHGDDIPLGTLKSLLAARQHLEDARDRIIANAASRWIDIPEKSAGDVGCRSGSGQQILEPRENPKKVLMEVLYPGEGKRILDRIDEVGKVVEESGKGRPWTMKRKAASLVGEWKL